VPCALPEINETQVVAAPSPTLSATFGLRVAAAAGQILVTGPTRAASAGPDGQIASFKLDGDLWTPNLQMAPVEGMVRNDLALGSLVGGGDIAVTVLERGRGLPHSVVVFRYDGKTWAQQRALDVPRALVRPGYGGAIATNGTQLAVSCVDMRFVSNKEQYISDPEVFMFSATADGWKEELPIMVPPLANGVRHAMWFGTSLALDSKTLAVGSPAMRPARVHDVTPASGQPYVFTYVMKDGAWQSEDEVSGDAINAGPGFGNKVAVEGDLMAVQAANITGDATASRVYVYRRTNGKWAISGELTPAAGITATRAFGGEIAISKGRIVVADQTGYTAERQTKGAPGMVLVFEQMDGRWTNTMRLQPKDVCGSGQFGQDIAVMWPWVAVGRIKNSRLKIEPGGAFLFKLEP
jgi:hypothetical protein